jgi:hypothetical protein
LVIEKSLGMSTGHAETIGLVKKYQDLLAAARKTRGVKVRAASSAPRKRKAAA